MEIDVLAKHKINNSKILIECKAYGNKTTVPSEAISKLLGNILLRNATAGWLVTTGPFSKDAEGIRSEWEERIDIDRAQLSFYTPSRIVELLLAANVIKNPTEAISSINSDLTANQEITLFLTDIGRYWLVPVSKNNTGFYASLFVYNAESGLRVKDGDSLKQLKQRDNPFGDYEWLRDDTTSEHVNEQFLYEYNSIVPVISGDDWTDYRPARPEDFVGRKRVLEDLFKFFDDVINNKTSTRLFAFKAPSGMGKSSTIIKLDSMAKSRRKSKKYFVYAVDVRTALSPRYAEMALKACIKKVISSGFISSTFECPLDAPNISSFIQSDCFTQIFKALRTEDKAIVFVFDQFEELFSKKELFGLFDQIQILNNIIDAQQENFIIGFSWKTDLTIPVEHPVYYLWSNLSDRRREFEITQFRQSEIKSAIRVFGDQLGERINPVLSSYLVKQCQGYPWLLKKLCIHVFEMINEGNSQDTVIGQKLNIVDLFNRDLSELTP